MDRRPYLKARRWVRKGALKHPGIVYEAHVQGLLLWAWVENGRLRYRSLKLKEC